MAWELDPDLALHTRVSLGRRAVLIAALVLAGFTLSLLVAGAPREFAAGLFASTTVLSLIVGLPFAAIHLLSLERDGRLDQQRLSGRSDARLALVVVGGAAWLLLAFGLPAFLLGPAITLSPMQVLALAIASAAMANLMLAVPRAAAADSRVLAAFVVLFTAAAMAIALLVPAALPAGLIASALVWAATVPSVLRRMRRPTIADSRRGAHWLRPLVRLRSARLAELGRVVLSTCNTEWIILVTMAMPALMMLAHTRFKNPHDRAQIGAMLVYVPLVVAAIDASARIRRERAGGSLERICLSGQGRWTVVMQMAAGYLAPYALLSLSAAAALLWFDPQAAWLLAPWPLAAIVMTFVGVAEALRDRRLGVYVMTASLMAVLVAGGRHGRTWWVIFGALWIPVVTAAECLERQDAVPIRGWWAPAAAAAIGAFMASLLYDGGNFYFLRQAPFIAGWMALAAGLLLPDRAAVTSPRHLLATVLACGTAAGLTQYYAIDPAMIAYLETQRWYSLKHWPSTFAVLGGCLAGAGLAYGWIAHNRFGATRSMSLMVRMAPIVLAVALGVAIEPTRKIYTVSLAMTMYAVYVVVLIGATAAILLWPRSSHARTQS